jgi:hypothetical protein
MKKIKDLTIKVTYRDNISELLLGITHWMPIPSFDEILEANKDVLERIKEKGD